MAVGATGFHFSKPGDTEGVAFRRFYQANSASVEEHELLKTASASLHLQTHDRESRQINRRRIHRGRKRSSKINTNRNFSPFSAWRIPDV